MSRAWSNLPEVHWPPDVPCPSVEEVVETAKNLTRYAEDTTGEMRTALFRIASVPWLVGRLRMSGAEAGEMLGLASHLRSTDPWVRAMRTPIGQAITNEMTNRLLRAAKMRKESP